MAAIIVLALIAGGVASSASAHAPDDGNTIHSCVKQNGDVSILLEDGKKHKDDECKKKDTRLDWSIQDTTLDQAGIEALGFFTGPRLTETQVEGYVTNGIGGIDVNGVIRGQFGSGSGVVLQIGNDTQLVDIDVANTVGLYGRQNAAAANLKLGSGGPTLSGKGGNLGIGETNPADLLTVTTATNDQGIQLQGATTGVTPTFRIADSGGAVHARIGIAGGTNELTVGAAANDLVIRSENRSIRFTVDTGASTAMSITSNGVDIAGKVAIGGTEVIDNGGNWVGAKAGLKGDKGDDGDDGANGTVFTVMFFERRGSDINFTDASGNQHTIDIGNGSADVNSTHIRYRPDSVSSGANAVLLFNITGSNVSCTLFHNEDDVAQPGYYYATDEGPQSANFTGGSAPAFKIRREGSATFVLPNDSGFNIVCLP